MIKILLFIKHKFYFIWDLIERFNGAVFRLFYYKEIEKSVLVSISKFENREFQFKKINKSELTQLSVFFNDQSAETYTYFKPHNFDVRTLTRLFNNCSFYMFGVFDQDQIVGYFMIRFFINKKAIVGFLVDPKQQGKGIAKTMGRIMFNICWSNQFKVFATVSKLNIPAIKSYKSINNFVVLKELEDNFIFIEFKKENEKF